MKKYIKRTIELTLNKYIQIFPVVAITGPRQAGKSTVLLNTLGKEYTYITFDDYQMVSFFNEDPEKFFSVYSEKIIFDEVQNVPEIFSWIKRKVDNNREKMGNFILTGSSQLGFIKGCNESLAGRIGILSLLPFTVNEVAKQLETEKMIYKGSYPEIILRNFKYSDEWYSSYISTYLERDIKKIINIGDIRDFKRCIALMAARVGQELNMATISRELGVSMPTIKRWISALEASYILFLLPPYSNNFGKRITKHPKIYFYDTGLAAFLTGVSDKKLYEKGPMAGHLFENFIIADLKKNIFHTASSTGLYYLRTSNGEEIDCIIQGKEKTEYIEIKFSATWKTLMTKTIEKFLAKSIGEVSGRLVYQGENQKYLPNVLVQNWKEFLKTMQKH